MTQWKQSNRYLSDHTDTDILHSKKEFLSKPKRSCSQCSSFAREPCTILANSQQSKNRDQKRGTICSTIYSWDKNILIPLHRALQNQENLTKIKSHKLQNLTLTVKRHPNKAILFWFVHVILHANLLCIVPILSNVPEETQRRQFHTLNPGPKWSLTSKYNCVSIIPINWDKRSHRL